MFSDYINRIGLVSSEGGSSQSIQKTILCSKSQTHCGPGGAPGCPGARRRRPLSPGGGGGAAVPGLLRGVARRAGRGRAGRRPAAALLRLRQGHLQLPA